MTLRWLSPLPLLFVIACTVRPVQSDQSDQSDAAADDSTKSPDAGSKTSSAPSSATCNIGHSGLTFDTGAPGGQCDTCINSSCCDAVVQCFGANGADCQALSACELACQSGTGAGTPTSTTPTGTTTTTTANAMAEFVSTVYPSLAGTCGSCHGPAGAQTKWLGADGASSYALAYPLANDLLNKGAHEGPALTTAQKTLVQKWITDEQTARAGSGNGGGNGNGSGGGGGGNGTGNGMGGGPGSGTGLAGCLSKCVAAHPNSTAIYNQFITCRTTTCASKCK